MDRWTSRVMRLESYKATNRERGAHDERNHRGHRPVATRRTSGHQAPVCGLVRRAETPRAFPAVGRESLYRALSPNGNPTLKTLLAVLNTVGMRLSVETGVGTA